MAKFRVRSTVDAVQLRWDTWNEVCDLIGEFNEDIRGVYIDKFDQVHDHFMGADARIGLRYVDSEGCDQVAFQDDWIIRGFAGRIFHWPAETFAATYEPVEADYNDHPPLT